MIWSEYFFLLEEQVSENDHNFQATALVGWSEQDWSLILCWKQRSWKSLICEPRQDTF